MKDFRETVVLGVLILYECPRLYLMESYADLVVEKELYGSVIVSRDVRRLFSPTNTIKMLEGYNNYVGAYS